MKCSTKDPQRTKSFYAWSIVGMLWCLCFLNYADRQILFSVFPVLEKEYGFSKFQLGMIGSIFMWMYASASLVAGHLSDRFKRKPLILIGCSCWSLIAIVTGWCSSFWQFLTLRGLEGLGESLYFPASNSMISDWHPKHHRSKALSLHQSGVYVGTVAGSAVGAFLAQHYKWSYGFYLFGGLGIVLAFFFLFFLQEPQRATSLYENGTPIDHLSKNNPSKNNIFTTLSYLIKRPAVVLILLTFISANFVAAIFLTWLPTFLYEKFQMNLTTAGFFSAIFIQSASALTIFFFGWIADRLAQLTQHGRIVVQIISLLIGAVAIACIGKATTLPFLFVAMTLFGACKAGYDGGIFSALFDYIDPHVRGSAVGLMNTLGWIGGAMGPLVVGAIATYGGDKSSTIARISSTLSASSVAYLLGAALLGAIIFVKPNSNVPE